MAIIDPRKATKEQIEQALALLNKQEERKEKIKRGEIKGSKKWSEMTPEEKSKAKLYEAKRTAKIKILCEKATAAGITVSEKEIDQYLAKK